MPSDPMTTPERVQQLEAENARLRQALRRVKDETGSSHIFDIAREALANG